MSSKFGKVLIVTLFGQSHGKAIGAVMDGLPAGETVDAEAVKAFMRRRCGGRSDLVTQRKEPDEPVFLSGIEQGRTCGFPLAFIIENRDVRSEDYEALSQIPRPGHADFTAFIKYGGWADMRGGGHFSGRLTAPLCAAGGIAMQILERRGIFVGAHLHSVGSQMDRPYSPAELTVEELLGPGKKEFPAIDGLAARRMAWEIADAAAQGDSVGGVIECGVLGLPPGLGWPMFDGLENQLAAALFGIPGVKGLEFGAGFSSAELRGSANNDPFHTTKEGKVVTLTNHHGGALGGITTGMPVILRAAVKPTPSISIKQKSVELPGGRPAVLEIKGRHDPCVALRAVPCVEAVTALVVLDMMLQEGLIRHGE